VLKGNGCDVSAIEELLVKYLGDLPMLGAPGQLVKCFVVSTQQSERLEVRLIRTYQHPSKVGRCRLTVSKPALKAPVVAALGATISRTAFKLCFQNQVAPVQQGARQRRGVGAVGGGLGHLRGTHHVPALRPHAPGGRRQPGRAVQVDPIKPTLKSPGTERLKVKRVKPLSNFALNSNLHRYNQVFVDGALSGYNNPCSLLLNEGLDLAAGTYTRSHFSST
jgi:hypothetical protein